MKKTLKLLHVFVTSCIISLKAVYIFKQKNIQNAAAVNVESLILTLFIQLM